MANVNDKNQIKDERIEDTTLYGEFVSSFHQWRTLDRQRQIAHHLEEVTEELATGQTDPSVKDKKRSR